MFENLINRGLSEQDFRLQILNLLLQTPHKNFEPYLPLFKHVAGSDPLFFAHLGTWYFKNGSVRDLKHLFIAYLALSDPNSWPEHREAAHALLQELPPFEVEATFRILKGYYRIEKHTKGKTTKTFVKGLANNIPRAFKTAVQQYLRQRESNRQFFDSCAVRAAGPMKTLYSSLKIKPSDYAQKILFEGKPPEGSAAFAVKQLAAESDPRRQAEIIIQNKIPYRTAVSAISEMSPTVILALVNAMSSQEVINTLASLQNRGALDNPDIKALVEEKLEKAKGDKRVSALKTRTSLAHAQVDSDIAAKVTAVGDARIKAKGRIRKATAILVDKSGSLKVGIDVGKAVAAVLAPVCEAGLHVYAFDSMCYPIRAKGVELSDWEKAFKGIEAHGNTAAGAPVRKMRSDKTMVQQIVLVTDQDETVAPRFADELQLYIKEMGVTPNVVIVNVGSHTTGIERALKAANIEVDTLTFNNDYYALPNIIPMLSGGGRLELLEEIMDTQLPTRTRLREPARVS